MIMWNLLFFFSRGKAFPAVPWGCETQVEGLGVRRPSLFINGRVGGLAACLHIQAVKPPNSFHGLGTQLR